MNFDSKVIEEFFSSLNIEYRKNFLLSGASSFKIGGPAAYAVYPKNENELKLISHFCRNEKIYHIVIGNGSNVIFSDDGFDGVVIITTEMKKISASDNLITAECGVSITHLASEAAKLGLGGLEFAYGIPGSVGGAVFMNAGAYSGETKDVIESVRWYDTETGEFGEYSNEENLFDYRKSIYQSSEKIIVSASFRLHEREPELIKAEMDDYMSRRRAKQPLEFPSAGSTFKRYPGYFTGKLIDDAGLKGFLIGGAQVSEKHAGFIVNRGGATAKDVFAVIDAVKKKIFELNGIEIECEVRYIPYSK